MWCRSVGFEPKSVGGVICRLGGGGCLEVSASVRVCSFFVSSGLS